MCVYVCKPSSFHFLKLARMWPEKHAKFESSSPLFLQFLEVFSAEVTAHKTLHPGDDLAQTFITDFF